MLNDLTVSEWNTGTGNLLISSSDSSLTGHKTNSSVTREAPMTIHIACAEIQDVEIIATMVGELLNEIMAAVQDKAFGFDHARTVDRAESWMKQGLYMVLLARVDDRPIGFLALYASYALYTEGVYGTIPEFYVRSAYRSQGIGSALLTEAKAIGQQRG